MNNYYPVIGLEIHVELSTKSKMFCQCDAHYFGKKPNTNTCPVCLGMPGALPVPNKKAVEWTIKIAQALGCTIHKKSKFDRKHYFYPDLPKGYQISQYDEPIATGGYVSITDPKTGKTKSFGITRVHLEEDTGKLTHAGDDTLVDFNRSSVPLVEIVTEPDFSDSEDVKRFLEELHTIIRYLEVSDANMEEGSMRLEPNISLSDIQDKDERLKNLPKYKVEIKNINSFNFAKKAIDFELIRQAEILDTGKLPTQETRGYDEDSGITVAQRSKEDAQDYRYFPEPDIPPMTFTDEEIEAIRKSIPELPREKVERYTSEFGLKYQDAFILSRTRILSTFYESILPDLRASKDDLQLSQSLEQVIASDIINKKIPSDIDKESFCQRFVKLHAKVEVDEELLQATIDKVLKDNPSQVKAFKQGKTGLLGYFVGQVMKELKGKAEPRQVSELLTQKLS